MEKILITGTGRCGTTFLIKLFTFLEYDTGFTKDNYEKFIFTNCNAGMEKRYVDNHYILKNPYFLDNIHNIIHDKTISVKQIIIPIRNFEMSAKSRCNNVNKDKNKCLNVAGGFVFAKNEKEQLDYYNKIMSNYIYYMVKFNINTLFLDFDKMISDKKYLYDKLSHILSEKNITFETFSKIYNDVSKTSAPMPSAK
jgi:hypothetical protein